MRKPNIICDQCKKSFYKKPSQIAISKNHYCSMKCRSSAAFADKPKITILKCHTCGKNVSRLTAKLKHHKTDMVFCDFDCKSQHIFDNKQSGLSKIADRPISDFLRYKGASKYVLIRANAKVVTNDRPKCCKVCSYNKHVQVCHIKAINTFPKTALVGEVNAQSNLILLCPNHHWELDHGLLDLVHAVGVEPTSRSQSTTVRL
jgi:hypothetical protein